VATRIYKVVCKNTDGDDEFYLTSEGTYEFEKWDDNRPQLEVISLFSLVNIAKKHLMDYDKRKFVIEKL